MVADGARGLASLIETDTRTGHRTHYDLARNLADRRFLDDWPKWIRNRHKDPRISLAPKRLTHEGDDYKLGKKLVRLMGEDGRIIWASNQIHRRGNSV